MEKRRRGNSYSTPWQVPEGLFPFPMVPIFTSIIPICTMVLFVKASFVPSALFSLLSSGSGRSRSAVCHARALMRHKRNFFFFFQPPLVSPNLIRRMSFNNKNYVTNGERLFCKQLRSSFESVSNFKCRCLGCSR